MAAPKVTVGPKSDKIWRDALRIAVKAQNEDGKPKIRALAEKCVQKALEGDMAAIKEIGDRMDGKAVQPVSGDEEKGPIKVLVERVSVD